ITLGLISKRQSDYNQAENYFKQAKDVGQFYNNGYNTAWAEGNLSSLYAQQGIHPDESIREAEKAREFFKSGGYRGEEVIALLVIARVNRKLGKFDVAERAYQDAIPISTRLGDQSTEALAHLEYGRLLANQERYPDALTQMDECYKLSLSLNQKFRIIYALIY